MELRDSVKERKGLSCSRNRSHDSIQIRIRKNQLTMPVKDVTTALPPKRS